MINIPHFNFPLYGIIIIISLMVGFIFVYKYLKRSNVSFEVSMITYTFSLIFMFLFAVLLTLVVEHKLGLSSMGAAAGVIVSLFILDILYVNERKIINKCYLLLLPLLYGLSKIGCLLAGCCHGYIYDGILSLKYGDNYYFPTQGLESILFIFIFFYLYKNESKRCIYSKTFIICGIVKFLLDYTRYTHIGVVLSVNQILCLISCVIGIILLFKEKKNMI